MNTVLMQGYKIELTWCDALGGHYFWKAYITSHGGQQHVVLKGLDIGPNDSPEVAMVKFMHAVGVGLGGMAKADAKELVPETMPP